MTLKKYKQKRDFNKTDEPSGTVKKTNKRSLRFVIQHHKATKEHFDLRLEWDGVLLSWAVPKGLSNNPRDKRLAVMVEDHPIEYIKFEGLIPKGNYGAGTVKIFDKGTYTPVDDFAKGLKKGHLKFILKGKKCVGEWSLVRTDEKNWLAIKGKDEFVSSKNTTPKKVKNPFNKCDVQLATLTSEIPKGKNWLFEIKYDGYRILSFIEDKKVKLVTRNANDYSAKFAEIKKSLQSLVKGSAMVLDGEVVAFDSNGRSDFGLLQQNIKSKKGGLSYVIFDCLAFDGQDLRNKPLIKRKEVLEKILTNSPKNLILSSFVEGKGAETFKLAKKLDLEGIVAKKSNSTYNGKRDDSWLKIKCYKRQEFVIGGYTTTDKNKYLSAILVGYYNNNKLIFVGKVGTGFSEKQRKSLAKTFDDFTTKKCPFDSIDIKDNVTYIKPKFVAEIQYTELTKEKLLRQPSFVGLREDKKPKQVVLEIDK